MAPELKSIISRGVQHHGSVSVIQRVMENHSRHAVQDPEVREMIDDLIESNSHRVPNLDERRKYSKDPLTDEEFEGIAVWIKEKDSPNKSDSESNEQKEAKTIFDQYAHHHYVRRWGLLAERKGKDEEWWIPNPPVLDESDPDYLCDMCRHIDLRALLGQRGLPGNELPGPTKITLHGLDRMLQREHCTFCRLISRKIKDDRILDFENQEALKGTRLSLNVLDDGPENALRLEIELEDKLRLPEVLRIIIQRVDAEYPKPFHGILLDRERASIEALRTWMMLCENAHPKTTGHCIEPKQPCLRLIDVDEKRIVEVEYPCRYVCLSYVWGNMSQPQYNSKTKSAFEAPNGLGPESVSLPQTITDAMVVTRQLGIRFLWIDTLCIQQDDDQDKASVIANMGAIYSNSVLTIVASTNSDPSGGLPGVMATNRTKEQIYESVQGMVMAVALHDHRKRLSDVENSAWNSRAWTYQERYLSQRALFFTDSQMCFICPHATFFEDTHPVLDPNFKAAPVDDKTSVFTRPQDIWSKIWSDPTQYRFVNKGIQTDDDLMIMVGEDCEEGTASISAPIYQYKQIPDSDTNGMLEIRGNNSWNVYRQAVDAYTCRDMSSDTDAVAAFEGMASLICQGANTKFWYGMPAFAFDQALLWYPREPLQRRRNQDGHGLFPSWSWAGWKGHCHYRGRGWHNGLYRCPVSAIHWLREINAREWFEGRRHSEWIGLLQDKSAEEIEEEINDGKWTLLEQLDAFQLYRFDSTENGWKSVFDTERNQHAYTHEQYPGVFFNYPVPLPDQDIVEIPDEAGLLRFKAHSNKARFCDMRTTEFVQQSGVEHFLQIGLGDENRSSNCRPSWQRIIYQQGYRAGFLMLNIPFEDIDLRAEDEYSLVAMSRDELPRIPPPVESWDFYRLLGPVEMHWNLGFKEEWIPEKLYQTIEPPNEVVTPDISPKSENGDAIWDEHRFRAVTYPLYNVLLVRKRGKISERIGVGKIHYHAFHHAGPELSVIVLK